MKAQSNNVPNDALRHAEQAGCVVLLENFIDSYRETYGESPNFESEITKMGNLLFKKGNYTPFCVNIWSDDIASNNNGLTVGVAVGNPKAFETVGGVQPDVSVFETVESRGRGKNEWQYIRLATPSDIRKFFESTKRKQEL